MFIRKCDCCGVDSTAIPDKNFISYTVTFGKFSTSFDFCPDCLAKEGTSFFEVLGGKSTKNEENM